MKLLFLPRYDVIGLKKRDKILTRLKTKGRGKAMRFSMMVSCCGYAKMVEIMNLVL